MSLVYLQKDLEALGYSQALTDAALRPGEQRNQLLTFLLGRLISPASLESVLSRLPLSVSNLDDTQRQLSAEEVVAHKCATLLNSLSLPATADVIRGCVDFESNVAFLSTLTSTLLAQQSLQGLQQSDTTPVSDTLPAAGPKSRLDSVAAEARLLDFACERFRSLTSEAVQLFPSDVQRTLSNYSASTCDQLLASADDITAHMQQGISVMESNIQQLSSKVHDADEAAWAESNQGVHQEMQRFLHTVSTFQDVYIKELGVWCESLDAPETHGLGPQAAGLLASYRQLQALMTSLQSIRGMHAALTTSAPPLQAYVPGTMAQIAETGRQEAVRLQREAEVLAKAARRLAQQQQRAAASTGVADME